MKTTYNPFGDMPEMCNIDNQEAGGKERKRQAVHTVVSGCVGYVLALIILLLFNWILGSCTTTKYVTIPEHHTDTLVQTKVQHDSIVLRDSIHVSEKGDTVRIERWHTQLVRKEVHDTTYIHKTDSVPVPYPVTEYTERQLTWWQRTQMYAGDLLLLILLGYMIITIIKKRFL